MIACKDVFAVIKYEMSENRKKSLRDDFPAFYKLVK